VYVVLCYVPSFPTRRSSDLVGLNFFFAEDDVRSAAELDHDLRAALGETLAGANIKGDAGPAPVVDQKFAGDKGFGFGSGIHVGRSEEHTSELQSRVELVCRR